ncbi:MAG: phosphoglycerate dehydrogenase [Alphaproteobacteria bacterium]
MSAKVFVSTVPFGEYDDTPRRLLASAGAELAVNPLGRRLKAPELASFLGGVDALIAGTEPITDAVMAAAPRLKLIARVGIGLDNVDLTAARDRGIAVSYTPDAPSPAVAELAIGHIIAVLRGTAIADRGLRRSNWARSYGRRIACSTIGVLGVGRIGSRVINLLSSFEGCRVLANDVNPTATLGPHASWADKETIYREADVITVHLPLTPQTRGLIGAPELGLMKPDAILINTARGGIVDEKALFDALTSDRIAGAAVDVFENEPYDGPLREVDSCLLSCHMGSMSFDCRVRMEKEATEEVVRLLEREALRSPVPEFEYALRTEKAPVR